MIAVPAYPPDPNRLNRSLPRLQAIVSDAGATVALTTDSILYMIKMLKMGNKLTSALEKVPFMRKFQTSMKYFSSGKRAVAQSHELGNLQWLSTDSISDGLADDWNEPQLNGDTISFLQYTSGSTGNPKGVILTHSNLLANSEIIYKGLSYRENTIGVFWLPIYHDMGLIGGVLQPLYSGVPSTLFSPIAFLQRPLRWLEIISGLPQDKTAASAAPNFAFDLCVKKATPEKIKNLDLSRWELALSGAEPVRAQTIERFSEVFKPAGFRKEAFFPAYGLAEATLLVSGSDLDKAPVMTTVDKYALKKNKIIEVPENDPNGQILVSSGHNQAGQRIAIVNTDTFLECKPGEIGEIWVKGPSVSKGYYKREQATKETFHNFIADTNDGPYLRTGDLGFMKDDNLFVAGRVKDLIIIRGTNHYPQDIELTVEQCHSEVRNGCSAVFTIDQDSQEQLVVVAEVRQSKNLDFQNIIDAIRQAVTAHHDLQTWAIVLIKARTIQKTSSGKIMRSATKAEYLEDKLAVVAQWQSAVGQEPAAAQEAPQEAAKEEIAAPAGSKSEQAQIIEKWLVEQLAESLSVPADQIDIRQPFISFGLDSAQAVGLAGDLEEWLDRPLAPTLIWDYPTIEILAKHLSSEETELLPGLKIPHKRTVEYEPIAIIGMGSRFPGANNTEEFWLMLKNGLDGIREVPTDRWDADAFYDPEAGKPGKMITKHGGFLEQVDQFDAELFGISPREAIHIDPQQRLLLEVSWEALENAGIPIDKVSGSRTGVFVGISANDYMRLQKGGPETINPYSGTGNAFSIAANRLSYFYNLHGPSLSLDTACSSSLVAVHEACQSLRNGDCDLALAGGVNLILSPAVSITFSQARMLSADGRCKTFDASADGYGRGEGAGIVVLKPFSKALEDEDHILAVISGSAINQDGRSNGITAPNGLAQQAVINEALDNAGIAPDQIQYMETHGTGTILGDPIEIESIKKVMLQERSKENTLYIGSVKTNIGHLESAAGVAGLIKTVLALKNREIPPHLNFTKLNPHVNLDDVPIYINTKNVPWEQDNKERFAAVSAFGFGGTNAHMILKEAPSEKTEETNVNAQEFILPLSGHNEQSLRDIAALYLNLLQKLPDNQQELYRLVYNATFKRAFLKNRLAVIAKSVPKLQSALQNFIDEQETSAVLFDSVDTKFQPKLAFIFSGQGPQWWAMGRELLDSEPIFRATVERISFLLQELSGWSLMDELLASEAESRLQETEIAQPAIFALQVALAALWRSWGIVPDAVAGHSVGEVAAAHISGILSLESAVKVIYHRGRLMQKATGLGKMAAIDLPFDELQELISGYEDKLSIGGHNSHTSYVLSGDEQAIDKVLSKLEGRDVFFKKLSVNYAFHSPVMEPFKEELKEVLQGLELQKMNIPLYSTVRAKIAKGEDYGPAYWADNIREGVQFSEVVDLLDEADFNIFIEVGPHPVLKNYIRQNLEKKNKNIYILPSLRRKEAERTRMLVTFSRLFTIGYPVDWTKLYNKKAAFLDLPLYPFQRERYWVDTRETSSSPVQQTSEAHPLLGQQHISPIFPDNPNWIVQLKSDYVAYLNPGEQFNTPVFPEAAYLEMAIAASAQTFNRPEAILKNIVFKDMLTVRRDKTKKLHFSLSPVSSKKAYFQAYSKLESAYGQSEWILHSLGSIVADNGEIDTQQFNLENIKTRLKPLTSVSDLFAGHKNKNYVAHVLLKSVRKIWGSQNEFLMKLKIEDSLMAEAASYHINPLLLNTCFELLNLAALHDIQRPVFYKPHSLSHFQFFKSPGKDVWLHIQLMREPNNTRSLESRLTIFDEDGKVLLLADGLRLQQVSMDAAFSQLLYEINWHLLPVQKNKRDIRTIPQRWLIFNDDSVQSRKLISKLNLKGKTCLVANKGLQNKKINDNLFQLNPEKNRDFGALLAGITDEETSVLWFWGTEGLDAFSAAMDTLEINPGTVWLFSRNAVVVDEQAETDAAQAYIWDQAEYLQKKHPRLPIRRVDIEHESTDLFELLFIAGNELHIARRGKDYYAPRLEHSTQAVKKDFNLEDLPQFSQERKDPAEQQLEIEIKSVGLNNRDLRLLKDDAAGSYHKLGLECSGIVRRIGEQVSNFKNGDEVILLADGSLSRYVLAPQVLVRKKPANLSFEDAAAIPYSFLTAHYGLTYLGRLQKSERILIHDAVTASGLAAISIARNYNCEIFATVRNKTQENMLHKLGVKNIMQNHSLDFIDHISEKTAGQGVDIIVNTSANEHLSGSFSILKEFGRFLEFNTDGSFSQPLVYHRLRGNISFFAIDMEKVAREQQKLVGKLFDEVLERVSSGSYTVPKFPVFPASDIPNAFAHLNGMEIDSKCIISFSDKKEEIPALQQTLSKEGSYFVAGAFDLNDLALLQWMYENGARNFYLFALSDTELAPENLRAKLGKQASVHVLSMNSLKKNNSFSGIIFSLSSLDDPLSAKNIPGLLDELYSLLAGSGSEFFLTLSSFNLLIAEVDKAPVLKFDHYIQALNESRRKAGRPALYIQMGGMIPQSLEEAKFRWKILDKLIHYSGSHLIITETDWSALLNRFDRSEIPALYQNILPLSHDQIAEGKPEQDAEINRTELVLIEDETERRKALENYLINEIAKVVKVSAAKIKPGQPLTSLGIDSLMAIELKNTVESKLGFSLPIATLLKGPSVNDLCADFLTQLQEEREEPQARPEKVRDTSSLREFKLSYGQKAMFFQHIMNPDSVFNLAYAVRIRSVFDKELLRRSFQELVDRHPSLRTTFHMPEKEPFQRIHPEMPAFFYEENVSELSDDEIRARLDEETLNHFDLENGPLMRVFLFQRKKDDYILLFVMHHIVTDIWSQAVLLDELSRIIENNGNSSVLPALSADYTDYIRWQDELLSGEGGEKLWRYWKNKLSGDLPALNLPTDRPRPPVQTYPGKTETLWFPQELSEQIHLFSEQQGVTVFTLLLAAYNILLHRYTTQDDIIVGSPTAGRSTNDFAQTIGYFVNPVPFRTNLSGNPSFAELLERVKHTVLEAFDNMDYPLSLQVEKLQPKRDPSRTPLFQTMFILQRAHLMHDQGLSKFALSREGASLDLGGLTIESMNLEQGVAPFDLTMMAVESGSGLAASLGYNTDLFDPATIRRMLGHYLTLLQSVLQNPQQKISQLNLLPQEESKQLLEDWNRTASPNNNLRCIHHVFELMARQYPQKTALVFEQQELTYRQLNEQANQLAHYLIKQGVKPETNVAVCTDRSPEMIVAILAALKAGGAYVPIDSTYPLERIRYMLSDSGVKVVLTQENLKAKVEHPGCTQILIDQLAAETGKEETGNPQVAVYPENLAYIIYTSGSTGKPKGTMLLHKGLVNVLEELRHDYHRDSESRILQFASFSFDASVEEIFSTLSIGATLYLVRRETLLSLADLIQMINAYKITNITLPPSVLSVLQPQDFPSLKAVVSAGEKCPPEIARRWSEGKYFINGYGPTEATICTTNYEISDSLNALTVPIGGPIGNVRVYVLDASLNPMPVGVPGELYIGGVGLARGYLKRPDLTAERFIPDPFGGKGERLYRTGDLVRYLPDGALEYLERIDQQVKIRGFRIELGEIETILKQSAHVSEAAVIARSHNGDNRILAYVVQENGQAFDAQKIKAAMKNHLPDYMLPTAIIELESLPLTSNGKLDRNALPDPEMQQTGQTFVKPGSETEKKLAAIWQEVLNLAQVGINDSFFDLGGHSLGIVQVQGKIKEVFDRELNVVDMFKYPTISSLAKFLSEESNSKEVIQKSQDRAAKQREATRTQQKRIQKRRKRT